MTSGRKELRCPECGGRMEFSNYRPMFPECSECGETFYIEDCDSVENED
ncbi:MAG: hypothetical protein ABEJ64_03685 [Candidatus Nanohaloarchaea archaeon]